MFLSCSSQVVTVSLTGSDLCDKELFCWTSASELEVFVDVETGEYAVFLSRVWLYRLTLLIFDIPDFEFACHGEATL